VIHAFQDKQLCHFCYVQERICHLMMKHYWIKQIDANYCWTNCQEAVQSLLHLNIRYDCILRTYFFALCYFYLSITRYSLWLLSIIYFLSVIATDMLLIQVIAWLFVYVWTKEFLLFTCTYNDSCHIVFFFCSSHGQIA
jgi:hypothetical protein